MSDFSDRPFVAGSLVGLRAFDVDALGRLKGPSFGGIFKPGENEATCGGDSPVGKAHAQLSRALHRMTTTMWYAPSAGGVATPLSVTGSAKVAASKPVEPEHVVAGFGCACGFYAYFNGENAYAKAGRVSAVIEGYGVCTVGDKGFRASKARLVALVLPKRRRFWGTWKSAAVWTVLFAYFAVTRALAHDWWFFGLDVALTIFWGVSLGVRVRVRIRHARKSSPQLVNATLVRRNYPDVPTYRTVKAALRKHPLTPPPPDPLPTPADEDFWTREVPR